MCWRSFAWGFVTAMWFMALDRRYGADIGFAAGAWLRGLIG